MNIKKIAAAFAVALTTALLVPTVASATEVCVPKDAWTETVEHPAVGTPTITIDNPDYVPATEGYYTTEENPDYVPATPDQTVADGFMKWNWTGAKVGPQGQIPPAAGWHQVGVTNDSKGATPDTIIHQGNGHKSYFYFQSLYKVIPGTPAQGEPTIEVWHDGTPAIGEPTIEVENPDYVAPWTETIQHEAVVCEPEIPVQPADKTGTEFRSDAPICVQPLDGTALVTTEYRDWIEPQDQWNAETWSWGPGERIYTAWEWGSTVYVDEASCVPTEVKPEPKPVVKPVSHEKPEPKKATSDELALTGGSTTDGLVVGGVILLTLSGVIGGLALRRRLAASKARR